MTCIVMSPIIKGVMQMKPQVDPLQLQQSLIKLMESDTINEDDFNLIQKYLVKINNDIEFFEEIEKKAN